MKICLWPSGVWCYEDEVWEYDWMSDDYNIMEVPDDVEDIDEWIGDWG